MVCKKCGFENIDGSKFCVKCGSGLVESQIETINFAPNNAESMINNQNIDSTIPNQLNVESSNMMTSNEGIMNNNPNMGSAIPNQLNVESSNVMTSNEGIMNNNPNMGSTIPNQFVNSMNIEGNNMSSNREIVNNNTDENVGVLSSMIGLFIKPITTTKEKINNLKMKQSIIATALVCAITTILTLIQGIISAARTTSYDWSDFSTKTKWDFSNLKELNFFDLIVKNYFYVAIAIVGIAVIYFVGAMIMKKNTKMYHILGITSLSLMPMVISTMILFPLLTKISAILGAFVLFVGIFYSFIIFLFGINEQVVFENENGKIYYHLSCIGAIILVLCLILSDSINSINSLISLF